MSYPTLPNYLPSGQPVFYVPIPASDMPSNGYWGDGNVMNVNPAMVVQPTAPSAPAELPRVTITPGVMTKQVALPGPSGTVGASAPVVESDSDDAPLIAFSSEHHDPELAAKSTSGRYNIEDASKHWIRTVKACSIISMIFVVIVLSVGFGANMRRFSHYLTLWKSSFFLAVWGSSIGIGFSLLQLYGSFKRQIALVIAFWVGIGASISLLVVMIAAFMIHDFVTAPISIFLLITYAIWLLGVRKVVHIKRCRCD